MELIAFTVLFLLSAIALPTLRLRARTGLTGYVAHRAPTPVHKVAIDAMRLIAVGMFAWPFLVHWLGKSALDVWSVPGAVTFTGFVCAALSLVLVIAAQANMGTHWRIGIDSTRSTALVTNGLFRVVRNPIFTGMLLMLFGLFLITPSPWTAMGWLFLRHTLALQVRLEEEHLSRLHGDTYREYASRVGRFLPRLFSSPRCPSAATTAARRR